MSKKTTNNFSTEVGQYVVIWITGCVGEYIAEVIEEQPLTLKVMESGPYARLKSGDYIIQEYQSGILQRDEREGTNRYLESKKETKTTPITGLASFGITDGKMHYIYPGEEEGVE